MNDFQNVNMIYRIVFMSHVCVCVHTCGLRSVGHLNVDVNAAIGASSLTNSNSGATSVCG